MRDPGASLGQVTVFPEGDAEPIDVEIPCEALRGQRDTPSPALALRGNHRDQPASSDATTFFATKTGGPSLDIPSPFVAALRRLA